MKHQQFKGLVSCMRESEKAFWKSREKKAFSRCIALEGRVDEEIEKTLVTLKNNPDYRPNAKEKIFFDLVCSLRTNTKAYHAEKKIRHPERERIQQLYDCISQLEYLVDEAINNDDDTKI